MKKWGMLITVVYAAIVIGLVVPAALLLSGEGIAIWPDYYQEWLLWLWIMTLVGGEALLLFVSVDTSQKKLRPRQHVLISLGTVALMVGMLTLGAVMSVLAAILGDELFEGSIGSYVDTKLKIVAWVLGLWAVWGLVFFAYAKSVPGLKLLLNKLLAGSVLELLIAVPSHVVVRQREMCTAPAVTSWGMATGVAIMLLCFGPGVLFLYQERIGRYRKSGDA